jgi:hypothetical protein
LVGSVSTFIKAIQQIELAWQQKQKSKWHLMKRY